MSEERAVRRLVHTFSTTFVGFYLIPPAQRLPWKVLALGLFTMAFLLEGARLSGWLPWDRLYGLRRYEQERPASYLYFGAGALPLILFAPAQLAIPCILCAGLADPFAGETRLHAGPGAAAAVGLTASTAFFVVVGLPLLVAVGGGIAFLLAEAFKTPWLDDDLLTLALPALVLVALAWAGLWTPTTVIDPIALGGI